MEWGAVSAWVAAAISLTSLGATLWLQWWRRPSVEWLLDGHVREAWDSGKRVEGRYTVFLQLVNCGDGAAYGVETRRCNGAGFTPFTVFEGGSVAPGEKVEVIMRIHLDHWQTCWVEPAYTSSPTRRHRQLRRGPRYRIAEVLADPDRFPPGYDPRELRGGERLPRELQRDQESSSDD